MLAKFPKEMDMKIGSRTLVALFVAAVLSAAFPCALHAQQYVYANNDDDSGGDHNIVTAFKVSNTGQMSVINTYQTGGLGTGGYNAVNTVAAAKVGSTDCLFVSNGGSNNVSAFTINPANGTLTAVTGSPFASGGTGNNFGIGLAVADNKLLFAGNTVSNNISVFVIKSGCVLHLGNTYNVPGSPDGMKVTPNGKFLIEANLGNPDSWQINSNGTLTELGPFSSHGTTVGVDISCDGTTAYFGDAGTDTEVEVYSISATGQLAELNDYTNTNGLNSNNVMLSADGTLLYVSETASNQVETLTTGANGALTYDSVVSLKVQQFNSTLGMATVQSGKGIFVAEDSPAQIAVLGAHGTSLKEVANSPFSLNDNFAFVIGIAAVPGKSCH
jgi:6-phosphogluconolactonase (cycloisomerase 2 family)